MGVGCVWWWCDIGGKICVSGKRQVIYETFPFHIHVTFFSPLKLNYLKSSERGGLDFFTFSCHDSKGSCKLKCRKETESPRTTCAELFIVNSKAIANKNVRTTERHVLSLPACVEIRQVSHTFRWSSVLRWGPRTVAFCQCGRLKSDTIFVLISTELIALDTDRRHYLDISPVLRFGRREILPRLHSRQR